MGVPRRIVAVTALVLAPATPLAVAAVLHPTPMDWRHLRFDPAPRVHRAQAGREDRTEMKFLARYEPVRTRATAFRSSTGADVAERGQSAHDCMADWHRRHPQRTGIPGTGVDVIIC